MKERTLGRWYKLTNAKGKPNRHSSGWVPSAAKYSPRACAESPCRTWERATQAIPAKRMDSSALINANSSWLAAETFHTHLARAEQGSHQEQELLGLCCCTGWPTGCSSSVLGSQGCGHVAEPCRQALPKNNSPTPPNIVSVTAVPLTRVFLARFSNLKDTLGKISSYDKVILSLLCCSRYTSPWFSSM